MISSDARSFTYKGQDGYFQPPHSIYPLPDGLSTGFIVLGTCGMLSFAATLSLLSFVAYRFITWKNHYTTFIGYNQYVLLFLNLCFADLCQSASFLVSFHWRREEAILAPTTACQAQGFLLHLGDVASAFFVLAIAVHTYWTAVMSRRVPYRVFGCLIVILWLIVIFLTVIGLAIHQDTYFVRAGAWCWISSDYEPERLGLHYFWVFLSEFGLIVLYAVTFFQLRQKTNSLFSTADRNAGISVTNQKSIDAVNRITTLMMLYPLVYVVLTLPLSAARMWSMARGGQTPSDVTNIATGALLASCGWVDCLLYTLTRERLLANTMNSKKDSSNGTDTGASRSDHQSKGGTILQTTTWTVQNESFDLDRNVEGNTAEVEAYSDPNSVRDLSPGRSKSETSGNARDRSPSPTGSVDPIIAREQQQQQQSNVSRMLSATRRKDFAPGSEKVYELDTFHS